MFFLPKIPLSGLLAFSATMNDFSFFKNLFKYTSYNISFIGDPIGEWIDDRDRKKKLELAKGNYYVFPVNPPFEWCDRLKAFHAQIIHRDLRRDLQNFSRIEFEDAKIYWDFYRLKLPHKVLLTMPATNLAIQFILKEIRMMVGL
ncbi:MAG: hypothetical protein H0V82_11055 [Candidatus Protochlamydia sp.]|nr:hypothetical protein [Candidatus Protochlamydia sp.]